MKGIPQEIRVSSMTISFENGTETQIVLSSVIIIGAVITVDGNVYKFSFERGKLNFKAEKNAVKLFNKTTQQRLEYLLIAYIHGTLKLNIIPCNMDECCIDSYVAEVEE